MTSIDTLLLDVAMLPDMVDGSDQALAAQSRVQAALRELQELRVTLASVLKFVRQLAFALDDGRGELAVLADQCRAFYAKCAGRELLNAWREEK